MIKEKTVFILGAGASMPYGFPSARQLRKKIIQNFGSKINTYNQGTRIDDWAKEMVSKFNDSGIYSIDNFLARNPSFLGLGKIAISLFLLESESKSRFNEWSKEIDSEWYSYLYNKHLINDLTTPDSFENFQTNKVSFITFNYDRSLEMYFYRSLLNSYEKATKEQVIEQVEGIKIIHVYGSLGVISELDFKNKIGFPKSLSYGKEIKTYADFELTNTNIRIMNDKINSEEIGDIINGAKRIFILGFGFDTMNIENIQLFDALKNDQKIYATVKGLTRTQVENIKSKIISRSVRRQKDPFHGELGSKIISEENLFFEDNNCLELLETYL